MNRAGRKPTGAGAVLYPQNPIRQLRDAKGMSRDAFARAIDVSRSTLQNHELGSVSHLQPILRDALGRQGYDPEKLESEYQRWLDRLAAADRAALRQGAG